MDVAFCLADVCNILDLQGYAVVRSLEKDVISSHPLPLKLMYLQIMR